MGAMMSRVDASISSSVTIPAPNTTKIGSAMSASARTKTGRTFGGGGGGSGSIIYQ
jgi:hypothetical protein